MIGGGRKEQPEYGIRIGTYALCCGLGVCRYLAVVRSQPHDLPCPTEKSHHNLAAGFVK